jgi:hypothetical protein
MIKGGVGGGNTKTGLVFEGRVSLTDLLARTDGYTINKEAIGKSVYYQSKEIARCYKQHDLYRYLNSVNVNWNVLISKKLLPDDALYVIHNNTIFVVEIKFQNGGGSVDEKLQTCDFKKKQYKKLFSQLNMEVEYIYVLSEWFKKPGYKDTLDYIISVGCDYYFGYIPLQRLGLPVPQVD